MPTIIVLDLSLSMLRPALQSSKPVVDVIDIDKDISIQESGTTLFDLAKTGIESFLSHLEKSSKLEFVSLIGYSSQCELLCPFTRDLQELREKLASAETFDNTNILAAFRGIVNYVQEQWTNSVPVNIVLVTDEGLGNGPLSLNRVASGSADNDVFPFGFQGSLTIMCLGHPENPATREAKIAYEKLIERTGVEGSVVLPEVNPRAEVKEIESNSVEKMFQSFYTSRYQQFVGTLKFGEELASSVTLCPPPVPFKHTADFEVVEAEVEQIMEIKGFLSISDVSSPPVVSRHLVLPYLVRDETSQISADEETRIPSLCVFLHGALKVENMCALVQVASGKTSNSNWFGILFSCSDTKKKSNLMLALFEPGNMPVPWLGDLRRLGPLDDLNATSNSPFPVKASMQKPSYTSSPVVWIKETSLHSDIQKILRNARKLPEKTPHFYKELNRLKRAALALGFHELLEGVAAIFERECSILPGSAHPDCAIQLSHAASELRSKHAYKYDHHITPLSSKFTSKRE